MIEETYVSFETAKLLKDKQLLLKDLCVRLPYGVKFVSFSENMKNHSEPVTLRQIYYHNECDANNIEGDNDISTIIEFVKPYLRPMSSMTEEEMEELKKLSSGVEWCKDVLHDIVLDIWYNTDSIDWLNEHHFDYRGLIEKGFALEAPEGMYKFD